VAGSVEGGGGDGVAVAVVVGVGVGVGVAVAVGRGAPSLSSGYDFPCQILSAPRAFHLCEGRGRPGAKVGDDSDEALVLRYQRGDVAAFEQLLERHRIGVFRFLARFVGDRARAEDLAQDCWLRVVGALGAWRERARFRAWLYGVARNLATDEARRAVHRRHESLDAPLDGPGWQEIPFDGRAPDDLAADALLRPALEAAIAALPPEQREVFLLREYEGVPFAEVAQITGAPLPTVKSRMRYALEALRRALAELEVAPADAAKARSATP
jgi:RNA polymerase sigma-70 factor (ECF subfamily)